MKRIVSSVVFVIAVLVHAAGCTVREGGLPARCAAIEIDPARELVVTDAVVLADDSFAFSRVMTAAGDASPSWSAALAFDLVAITNRIDFVSLGVGRSAELRFVYGAREGATRLPMSVIVEIALPDTRGAAEWATAWHRLGSMDGPAYQTGIHALVREVLSSPIHGQVRIQDGRHGIPVLTQWALEPGQAPAPDELTNTPAPGVDVSDFVRSHEGEVRSGSHVLPRSYLASQIAATAPELQWTGVGAETADAFARSTCNGCHTEEETIDGTFHVSPLRRGDGAMSPFLRDEELPRRADVLRGLLCR